MLAPWALLSGECKIYQTKTCLLENDRISNTILQINPNQYVKVNGFMKLINWTVKTLWYDLWFFVTPTNYYQYQCCHRKYKDYVYRKMLVQEYLKKWRIFKRVKPKNDMMYHDIYNCICQNTKKIRFIIHYVKPTAQLLCRIRFPKGGPTCRRQVVNPRHQTSQGQSVAKPETPLQNIQVE